MKTAAKPKEGLMKRVKSILQPVKPSSPVTEPPRALPPRPTRRQHVLPRIIGTSLGLWLLVLSALGQPSVPPPKTTPFTRALIGTNSTAAEFRSALGFVSTNISSVTNYVGNGAAITNIDGANIQAGTITTQKVDSVFYQLLTNSPTLTAFTDTYKAWVSAAGSDTTGTVGKEELPFATVSNAVRAVKVALGSSTSRGVVLVGAGVFGEYWVNLQRTNLPGISLIGVSPQATMLTSTGTSYLTNLGPLVVLGHNSTVANLSISNNINAGYKQAAIGWDASRGTTAGTTFVVPTNIFIQNVIGQGSSDVGYFYDSGSSYYSMWLDKVDFESKWDAFFLSTAAFDGQVKITKSSIRVYQPDDYGFPDGGSGNGRARAVYVGEGYLTIADSSVIAIGGANTVNETTALTHFGSTEGYTNMNTALSASSTGSGAVTLEYYSSSPSYIGKLTPGVITTNEPYANSVPLATSYRTAKQINLFTNQNNWSGSNYWSGLTKFAGPVGMANLTATDGATWSLNNLLWSMSSGKMAINGGAINYTNDPNGLTSWYDVNATDYLLYLEPDGVGSGPRVYLYNPFGNGAGFTNIPATAIAGGSQGQVVTWHGAGAIWSNPPAGGSFTLTMNPNQFGTSGGTTNFISGAATTNINHWKTLVLRSEDAGNDITVTNHSQKLKINSTANPYTADTEVGEDIKARTFYGTSNNISGGISANTLTVTDNASVGSLTFTNSGNTNSLVMFNANGQLTNPAVAATSIMRKNGTAVTVGSGLSDDGTTLSTTGGSSVTIGVGLGTFVGMMTNTFWETGEGIIVKDNFRGAANNPLAAGTGVAGGSAAQAAAGVTGQAGVFKVYATPTNTGGYGTYRAFGTVMPWQSNFVNDVSLAVNGYEGVEHFIGLLAPMSAAAATDRVGWLLNTNWSPNWIAACMSNSVPYYWTSSLAAADSSIVRLSVYCPNRTNAYFFTNGILATTISTNTPVGRSLTFSARVLALTAAGSSAQQNLYLDWNWFLFY